MTRPCAASLRPAVGAALAAALLPLAACGATNDDGNTHQVVYSATGTAMNADLTWTTDGASDIQHASGAGLPWTQEYAITTSAVATYQLIVQNPSMDRVTVACQIKVDGKVVASNTASGPAVMASCTYTPNAQHLE